METNNLQLDGTPFEKAMQPILTSLKEFRDLVIALDNTSTGRLRGDILALKGSAVGLATALEAGLSGLPAMLEKQVSTASQGINKKMRQAGKEAGEGFVSATGEGAAEAEASGKGLSKRLRVQQQAEYDAMLNAQKIFTLESIQQWRTMGTSIAPEHRKMLADAAAFTGKLQAEYAKAEVVASTASRMTSRASGLFGANVAEAGAIRSNSAGADDLRGLATPATLAGVQRFAAELSASGEAVKLAYAKAHLATREGSAAMLSAMRDFYSGQEAVIASHAGAKNAEVGALLGRVEAKSLFQARAEAFAAQASLEKKATESSIATLSAMGAMYRQEALLAAASAKNTEVGSLLGRVEAQRLFQARSESFAAQAGLERRAAEGSAATLANMGTMYQQDALLAHVSAKNEEVGTLLGKVEAQRFFQARSKAFAAQALLEKKATESSAGTLSAMGAMYRQDALLAQAGRGPALEAADAQARLGATSAATASGLRSHAGAARELHSAYRGLASGFGAMWLTWGSILPLLAGAAVSHAASQAIRIGAEVGQSLAVIQHLGGATAEEMVSLNRVLLETSRSGPFGPKEVAKALETLSLAGLSAREQMEALKPTLDFSVAGQMSIEKGAGALVAISTAFGYQSKDMRVVSDIVTKTAAISMASAESMASSFKVASVVAQQYNVSLLDVATTLALLAQVGIKDQAAGTAVRQMYSELIGTSAKARKVMQDTLKFDAFDALGKTMKPLPQMFEELSAAFVKLSAKAQNRVLLDMGNERATKAMAANLRAVQGEVQKSAKEFEAMGLSTEAALVRSKEAVVTNMAKIRAELEDAPGFSALAAIGLGNSTQNQMKTSLAGLQTSLVEAFQSVEPVIARVATSLQILFKSEEFRTALTAMVSGVAELTGWLIRNFDSIAVGAVAYYAYTLAVAAGTAATAIFAAAATTGGAGAVVLAGGTATAGVAAAGASVSFGALALTMLPLTLLAAAVGGAYYFLTRKVDETVKARENELATAYRTLESVKVESERLRVLIDAKGDEAKARVESARILQEATLAAIMGAGEEKIRVLQLSSGYLELAKAKDLALGGWDAMGNSTGVDDSATRRLADLDTQIAKIKALTLAEAGAAKASFDLLRTRAKEAAAVADKRRTPGLPQGDGTYNPLKPGSAVHDSRTELKNMEAAFAERLRVIDREEKAEQGVLKMYRDVGLTSEAAFQKQSEAASTAASDLRMKEFDQQWQDAEAQVVKMRKIRDAAGKGSAQANRNDTDTLQNFMDRQYGQKEALEDANTQRRRDALVQSLRPMADILKNEEMNLAVTDASLDRELLKLKAKTNGNELTERERYIEQETLTLLEKKTSKLQEMLEARKAMAGRQDLAGALDPNSGMSEETRALILANFEAVDKKISSAKENLLDAGVKVKAATAEAFDAARVKAFAKELNTKLVEALFSAGKDGGKSLRKYIQEELLLKPFKLKLEALLDPFTKAASSALFNAVGLGGSGTASGGVGLFGLARQASSLLTDTGGSAAGYMADAATKLSEYGFEQMSDAALSAANSMLQFKDAINIGGDVLGYAGAAYSLSQGNYGAAAGAAIGTYFGGPIGAALGSYLGGMLDGGPRESTGGGIEGNFGSSGFQGNSFSTWKQDGGWFGDDESGKNLGALDSGMASQFNSTYAAMKAASRGAAASLGLTGDAINNFSRAVSLTFTDDAKANEAAVANMFTDMANAMADTVAPAIASFKKSGEGSAVALSRLSAALVGVNLNLGMVRVNLLGISLAGGAAASDLADAFGGLEKLSTATKAYYDVYFTAAERGNTVLANIAVALEAVGLSVPHTKEEFRKLVEGVDANTVAGRKAYVTLIKLAPEFATATDEAARFATETATKLLATFTGKGLLVPALNGAAIRLDALTSNLTKTSGAVGKISAVFLKASAGLIDFGVETVANTTALTDAQASAVLLNDQLEMLRRSADKARVDFVDLGLALNSVDTGTFVATIGMVFENLASRLKGTIDAIGTERTAVRQAALQILNPTVMTKTAIQRAISEISVSGPSNSALTAAQASLRATDAVVAARTSSLATVKAAAPSADALNLSAANLQGANNAVDGARSEVARYRGYGNSDFNWFMSMAEQGADLRGVAAPYDSGESNAQTTVFGLRDALAAQQPAQQNYDTQKSLYTGAAAVNAGHVATAQESLNSALGTQATALLAAKAAQIAYMSSLQDFGLDSAKAVVTLTRLREETVKYYDSQKQLADSMSASAKGLREGVYQYKFNQMSPQDQFTDLQTKFATAYSMALSTDGGVLAGYGDQLRTMLDPLLQKAKDVYATDGEFNAFAATTLARADNVAARIEALTPVNYAADSLALLGAIDSTLAAVEASSRSAEKIISDAISAGSEKTANGLRAVIAALTGQAIPGFAAGGDFPGGLRIVGENGPELEMTGPSRIFNAGQTRDMLGGSASNSELIVEVRALREQVARMSAETQATAINTAKLAKFADRNQVDGVLIRNDIDTPVFTKAVA